jgi:hypothetical protein
MTESTDGSTPVSEPVNRVEEIIKHPDEDQLNPEFFRLDLSDLDVPVAKTVLTAVPIRRPAPLEWVRVHRDPNYRVGPVPFVHLGREFYLVDPLLRPQLRPLESRFGEVFLAINRLEHPFFWIVTLQSSIGKVSDWYTSAYECALIAMDRWVQVVADQSAGCYQAGGSGRGSRRADVAQTEFPGTVPNRVQTPHG